jgi:Protein of unknown function (DUF3795)
MQSEDDDLEGVAFCGIYCDGCFLHAGKIANLARDLRRELRAARFDRAAEALSEVPFLKAFKGYPACDEVLGALVKVRCKRTCREGGGPQHCDIRICCQNKGIDGCWQCEDFRKCQKLEVLCKGHGDAHIRNLNTLKRKGVSAFISGKPLWYSKPKVQRKAKGLDEAKLDESL